MPNVVIVDDQSADRQILTQLIQNLDEDIQADPFEDAAKALAWLRQNQADLILVDYRLPGMDGLDFLRACRGIVGLSGVPVIVITVVQSPDLRFRALEAGATDFLNKPLDLKECQARCRNLLTLRRQQLTISRHAQRLAAARERLSRALATLSLSNELLVGTSEEQGLLEGLCRLVVEEGGYPDAWVGFLEGGPGQGIREVAAAGRGGQARVAEQAPLPTAPLVAVAETGQPWVLNDLAEDAPYQPWATTLAGTGVVGLLVLPVGKENHAHGVLVVYAEEPHRFDDDEVELLARTADTIGYGVAARRAEKERQRAEADVDYLASCDPLTGLPNRTGLMEQLGTVAGEADDRQVALLAINLDRFKLVNDTAGHEAGDKLLQQVVDRLQGVIREGDVLARPAGDEFALLVRGPGDWQNCTVGEDGAKVAERIIRALRQPFEVAGNEYYIGASVGITTLEAASGDTELLLQQADIAVGQAKEAGGATYAFYAGELTERHSRRLSLESRLHRAVEAGDFVLFYQPIVKLDAGTTEGVEALLRWPQTDGTLLGPETFIPLAEETGLMVPLGAWVFGEACRQARAWLDAGRDLPVSVNLSTHQLLSPTLVQDLTAGMEAAALPPTSIELEVTEGALMTDPQGAEAVLQDLHALGLRIAVDDFGTGYSSLSRLKQLPISTLKIDKAFVLGLLDDPSDRTITRSIIQLAGNLGMQAVAEGVESDHHRRLLTEMGCPFGQGYHFGRPAEADGLVFPETS